jgi:sugar phosphate isomerase/epimerase
MRRRSFLRATVGAGATLALPSSILQACRPESVPVSAGLDPIGVQLYTIRDLVREDMAGALAAVADIGYGEVEFAGYFDNNPVEIRAWLDDAGLTAPAAHVMLAPETLESTLEDAAVLGHRYLVVPWIPPDMRQTLDDYRRVAEGFNEVGLTVREAGFQLAYHNHDFEFEPMDGQVPFDILLEETDTDLVQIELDLFWLTHGGGDPFDYFARYPGRYPMVHVKDRLADGTMVDVGDGAIDFPAIFADSKEAGIKHYFVEHDQPEEPLESIRRSYAHLADIAVEG